MAASARGAVRVPRPRRLAPALQLHIHRVGVASPVYLQAVTGTYALAPCYPRPPNREAALPPGSRARAPAPRRTHRLQLDLAGPLC